MLPFNARNNNQGFTMIEILVVIIIVGILSAIAAPSYLGMLNRNKVNNALVQVRGALQEAQREAIRRSKSCTVYIPNNNTEINIISNCFVSSNSSSNGLTNIPNGLPMKKIDGVAIKSKFSSTVTPAQSITYTFKGNTTDSTTIALYMSDGSAPEKKCIHISNGTGIMRNGKYDGDPNSSISSASCSVTSL